MTSTQAPAAIATLEEQWGALVSTALLGSDRRPPPPAPPGPLDEVWRTRGHDPGAPGVLDQVATITAMRRAGVRPSPPVPLLVPAPSDPRPQCSLAAIERLYDLLSRWPQLVDTWLSLLHESGQRLPPDVAAELLARWRNEPHRRAAVAQAAGPIAEWLEELFPSEIAPLRAGRTGKVASPVSSGPGAPAAGLPADVAPLADLDGAQLAAILAARLERGAFGVRHRAPLVQLLTDLPVERLQPLPVALERAGTNPTTMGLALLLADLARTRLAMIEELNP